MPAACATSGNDIRDTAAGENSHAARPRRDGIPMGISATRCGGMVLCGGRSVRMGHDKATLRFGSELMLQRVVRLLGEVVQPVVVVAAAAQRLPSLPSDVLVTRDARAERGPLQGLLAGLTKIASRADAVFLTSCDAPLLQPAFVSRMFELLEDYEIAVAKTDGQFHPLAAVYQVSVMDRVTELLRSEQLRIGLLCEQARTRIVNVEELRAVDPDLRSLRNLNHRADYLAALAAAGIPVDPDPNSNLDSDYL